MTDIVGKLPELPEPIGELRSDEFDGHVFVPSGDEWPFEPLYTADQTRAYALQAVEALRPVAMTEERIVQAQEEQGAMSILSFMKGVRYAEAHHGITQKKQG